jgi:uncharacterized protein (DUF2237 family)
VDAHPHRARGLPQGQELPHGGGVITERASEALSERERVGPGRDRRVTARARQCPHSQPRRLDSGPQLDLLVRHSQSALIPVQRMAATGQGAHCRQSRDQRSALRPHDGDTGAVIEVNILGGPLEECGQHPLTGFYRDGCCRTGPDDRGSHTICAVVTAEFLEHQRSIGNDLSTPVPLYGFPGLSPGDRWCVTAANWLQAHADGAAAFVVLAATNERAQEIVPREVLGQYAVDVPEDPGALQA